MGISLTKKSIQLDAWVAKKFMVLLKRKLQRGQVPRTGGFRHLMAAVFPEIYGDQACPSHLRFERFYGPCQKFPTGFISIPAEEDSTVIPTSFPECVYPDFP